VVFADAAMKILVTAGNTLAPIDRVRGITNIFTGRTGASIAVCAHGREHDVTLLTSHPDVVSDLVTQGAGPWNERWHVVSFVTFADLHNLLEEGIQHGGFDAVIHCAAVSDYQPAGTYAPAAGTSFDGEQTKWEGSPPRLVDRAADKVKSDEPELWLRLVRTPKLVDLIRADWRFRGVLVKFKLEVGVGEQDLLEIAERSREQSNADLMVANTLDGAPLSAYLGPLLGRYERVPRRLLAERLLEAVEDLERERRHG
jgi:phosphopantothenoylcysteine synthetase/decarboxylase